MHLAIQKSKLVPSKFSIRWLILYSFPDTKLAVPLQTPISNLKHAPWKKCLTYAHVMHMMQQFPHYWPFVREINWPPVDSQRRAYADLKYFFYVGPNKLLSMPLMLHHCNDLTTTLFNKGSCKWEVSINTLRRRQNGRHFPDDIFKCIFLNENVWISIKIPVKFVPKGPINNIPALFQIMAWRRPGDKPLSETMMVTLLTHICVTRPQ